MCKIKLIIFDCDGVLIDSEIISNRIHAQVRTEMGFPMSTKEHIRAFSGHGINSEFMRKSFEILPGNFLSVVRDRSKEAYLTELKAVSGVREALAKISLPKCIASNSDPEKLKMMLKVTGLSNFFVGTVFSSHMVKVGKPAPDLYFYVAEKMKFTPMECLVIEDSAVGVRAARAAGMKVFGFVGGGHVYPELTGILEEEGVELVFSNMRELPTLISDFESI